MYLCTIFRERNSNQLQCSCLENSMDKRAWQATVHGLQRVRHDWATNTHVLFYPQETLGEYKILHPTEYIKGAHMHTANICRPPHSIYNELHTHIRCYNFPIWFQRTLSSSLHSNQIATLPTPTFVYKHQFFFKKKCYTYCSIAFF